MYAVTVTLTVEPDHWAAFLPLMKSNADASLRDEPECLRFDIATDPDRPHEVFLYELYTDRAGFDARSLGGSARPWPR